MSRVIFIALCGVCLLLVKSAISLKCRTGVQADDQFRKIVQVCKKRSTGDNNYSHDSSSSEEDNSDSESSLNIDLFDTKFFLGGNKYSNSLSWKDQSDNNRNRGNDRRGGNDRRSSFNYTEENSQYSNRGGNNRYFNGAARSTYEQPYNSNSENDNKGHKQACIIQCFFNELNLVDQRGFPEQDSIIQLMTHNVHNPELQDFLEEAVRECFHYLSLNLRQDNCYVSQNLLTCLSDKGKERCEDWSN